MRITLDDGRRRRDVVVTAPPRATLAEVSEAVGWDVDGEVLVDGVSCPASTPWRRCGLRSGGVLGSGVGPRRAAAPAGCLPPPRPGDLAVAVTGGLVAGPRVRLEDAEVVIGRDPSADVVIDSPTVSGRHVRLSWDGTVLRAVDLDSTNGTWVGQTAVTDPAGVPIKPGTSLRLGAVTLRVETEDDDAAALASPPDSDASTVAFLRPPREALPPPPSGPTPPEPPSTEGPSRPLTVTMLIAPLMMAAVMYVAFGRWQFVIFALMTPLVAVGNWVESRRRAKKARSGGNRTFNAALDRFRDALRSVAEQERERRLALAPDPAECLRRASLPSLRVWERRRGAADFLALHLGTGVAPWDPPVEGAVEHDDVRAVIDACSTISDSTVLTVLSTGALALSGLRDVVTSTAGSLLCQAATHHSPSDLSIAVIAAEGRLPDWEWLKWLPHTRDPTSGASRAADAAHAGDLVTDLADSPVPVLVLVDVAADDPVVGDVGRLVGAQAHATALVLSAEARSAPEWVTAIVRAEDPDGEATLLEPARGRTTGPFVLAGVTPVTADRWARALGWLHDPDATGGGVQLPDHVGLESLLGRLDDAGEVERRWKEHEPGPVPIGVGPRGRADLDFETAGPFGVVVGAAGSGRSTTLRTLAASAAASAPPSRLALVLWSVGEPTFGPLAELPHVAAHLVGPGARDKLLGALRTEVARRAAGATGPDLLVLVDDAQAVTSVVDTTIDELADVAATGSALGVRVVVASRRWGGVLARAAAAVPGPRLALRLAAESDASSAVGDPAPAAFDRDQRGRAMLADDDRRMTLQVARADAPGGQRAAVTVEDFPLVQRRRATLADPQAERAALTAFVTAVRETAVEAAPSLFRDPREQENTAHTLTLADLLGEDVAAVDATRRWSSRPPERTLVATVGTAPGGGRFELDLREAALGGQGPHGVCVGATGSGKSEFLRTLLADLLANHAPDDLAFVLVDFKGGATFAPIARLPHIAGVITNLQDDLAMIDRMQAALDGETRRRQQLLHEAGVPSAVAYREERARGRDLPPLPSLVIVVDEFAEMLADRPEFLEVLGTIGRVGRSLGVHLLLASQRLEEGRLRGLDSHLRYRVALRTFNVSDSRAIIGTQDAAQLPSIPGAGFVKLDEELVRFQSGFVSGPVGDAGRTELDVLAERLAGAGAPVHRVWLPPLKPAVSLDRVTGGAVVDEARGLTVPHWPGVGQLVVPLGVLDRPEDQRQEAHALDLRGAGGNVAVIGAPQTGKTTTLRTFAAALALAHTPVQVQLYGIDHGGGGLAALEGLPHVGSVAGRRDADLARRIMRQVAGVLAAREQAFAEHGVDSMADYRSRRAAGEFPADPFGDVFLLVDGWTSLKSELPDAEALITDVAARGLGYGVHVAITANRWMDLRANTRDGLGTKVELRLTDPFESLLGKKTASTLPTGVPGRGLAPDGHHLQVALPRIDGEERAEDVGVGLAGLVGHVAQAWDGPCAPPVLLLPERVTAADLPDGGPPQALPLGISEAGLEPVSLDLTGADAHFLVFGDSESGKSTVLRSLAESLVRRCSPEQARIMVVDYRRTLLEVVPESHLLAYAGAAESASENVARFRDTLRRRVPGDELTTAQLRSRSWWTGPELYLLVDDYDLVVNPSGNPLASLMEFIAQGRDLGFHVVIARRASGASRGFDPLLQRIRELGAPGLLLSGDPKEGPLLAGQRAEPQPPGRGLLVRRNAGAELVQTVATDHEAEGRAAGMS